MTTNSPLVRSPGFQDLNNASKNTTTSSFGNFNSGFKSTFSFGKSNTAEKPIDPLIQRLNRIRDALKEPAGSTGFSMNKSSAQPEEAYRFSSVAYNISIAGQNTNKPAGISQQNWEKELAKAKQYPMVKNPDSMVPTMLNGFQSLEDRIGKQKEFIAKMYNKLQNMRSEIKNILNNDDIFVVQVQQISKNNRKINEKLMAVLQKKEIESIQKKEVESNTDLNISVAFTPQEHELYDRLQKLENEISKPNKFKSALNALNLKSIMIRESNHFYPEVEITNKTDEAEDIIKSNHDAISSLVNLISKTQKSTSTLEKTYQEKIQTYIESLNSFA